MLLISVCFVILSVAISKIEFEIATVKCGFSSLLVCMMLGTIFCNICDASEELMTRADRWATPLMVLFFVLSGAELQLNIFKDITAVIIGVVYIVFRSAGKYLGARYSAKKVKCDDKICKHLGTTLLPQAGVALGMSMIAASSLPNVGLIVRNITLFSVLVYELIGPLLTKNALIKAGEIDLSGATNSREKNA